METTASFLLELRMRLGGLNLEKQKHGSTGNLLIALVEVVLGLADGNFCVCGQQLRGGRLAREGLWDPQEMETGCREGCHRCPAAKLGMRLVDWTWRNRGRRDL